MLRIVHVQTPRSEDPCSHKCLYLQNKFLWIMNYAKINISYKLNSVIIQIHSTSVLLFPKKQKYISMASKYAVWYVTSCQRKIISQVKFTQ